MRIQTPHSTTLLSQFNGLVVVTVCILAEHKRNQLFQHCCAHIPLHPFVTDPLFCHLQQSASAARAHIFLAWRGLASQCSLFVSSFLVVGASVLQNWLGSLNCGSFLSFHICPNNWQMTFELFICRSLGVCCVFVLRPHPKICVLV